MQRSKETRLHLGVYLRGLLGDFRSGWAYILGAPLLALAIGAQMGEMLLVESTDSFSVLAFKGLGISEALIGAAIGCSGLGNVVCALAIGQWGQRINPLREMGLGNLLVGVASAALGVGVAVGIGGGVGWFPVVVLAGAGFAALWIPYSYIIQSETADSHMGRVSATSSALYTLLGLVGIGLGTFLVQHIGVGPLFAVEGGLLVALGAFLLFVRLPYKTVGGDGE